MEYEISTRKNAKKNAINALVQWLILDLKLTKARAFVQIILVDGIRNLGEVSQISPGYFAITIDKKLNLEKTLQTVCHEMVHVKQFVKGKLRNCPDTGDFIWCSMPFPRNTNYYCQPWEIQAFSQEILLFRRATEFFIKKG
jgi:hypothetical protein